MYQNPEPNEEILECFNEKGNIIESHTRQEIHTKPIPYWHGVVNVWLVNEKSQLLCSKRSDNLSGNPGKWQTYFGGHVKAGKTFKESANSELDEEVGLKIDNSKLCFIEKGTRATSKHFYESYAYLFLGNTEDLKFNDGEIAEVKWFDMKEYWKLKEAQPDKWCNSCSLENQKKIKQCLIDIKKSNSQN
ncbi:MAG: NUDIX domain-containing protein [Patescibacteria group bacterium]|jgi:isopentenyldiphosphate isomerase